MEWFVIVTRLVALACVGYGSVHHFGAIEGLGLWAAVWLLMPKR